jgi:tetratricopeptide (TPR) repeat protein
VAALAVALTATPVFAQSFGASKTTVKLQRKLPALVHLPGDTIRVKVTAHQNVANVAPALASDLQSLLETELLKDDPKLRQEETNPATMVNCEITAIGPPQRTVTQKPNLLAGKGAPKTSAYVRITASLSVSFQAKSRDGHMLGSDNVAVNYDQEFDSSGNNTSGGIPGVWGKVKDKWKPGSSENEEDQPPPTDAELRTKLLGLAVQQMAEQIVNTDETIEVYLAKDKGPLDDGDKLAKAGLWERALETFETAPPITKKDGDAYRLYDIGVANEALGYAAEDPKSAMKFLDEAAINYGKAIDDKPGEKYFLEPQKRIQTAIAHYKKLEDEKNAPPPPPPPVVASETPPVPEKKTVSERVKPQPPPPPPKQGVTHQTGSPALTNARVIAMVKDGIDDETVAQAVRNAKAVDFNLSSDAQRKLTAAGVSPAVLSAMKARAAQELAK